jgi:DNA-binding NarL/FixJ family response regulator
MRALIVDDSDGFLVAARSILERDGIEVVGTAVNGVEALRLAEELRPDVVLLDVYLGADSGFEVAQRLGERVRALSGDDWRPAIILISTHPEVEFTELIDESLAIGFLGKAALSAKGIRDLLYGRAD